MTTPTTVEQPDVDPGPDPAGGAQAGLVVAADGVGDAHGGGCLQPERQHEDEGVHVDGVLIGGQRVVAEPAREHCGGGEGHGFHSHGERQRRADPQQLADRAIVPGKRGAHAVVLALRQRQGVADDGRDHAPARDA